MKGKKGKRERYSNAFLLNVDRGFVMYSTCSHYLLFMYIDKTFSSLGCVVNMLKSKVLLKNSTILHFFYSKIRDFNWRARWWCLWREFALSRHKTF